VRELDLSHNAIGDAGAAAIGQALGQSVSLQVLVLAGNGVSKYGALYIAKGLKQNSTLLKLDLSTNAISDAGAAALAEALQFNHALKSLDVTRNLLTNAGAVVLAEALRRPAAPVLAPPPDGLDEPGPAEDSGGEDAGAAQRAPVSAAVGATTGDVIRPRACAALPRAQAAASDMASPEPTETTGAPFEGGLAASATFRVTASAPAAESMGLLPNRTLLSLRLDANSIGAPGAAAIGRVLACSDSLTQLSLASTRVGDACGAAIGQALTHNASLKMLSLAQTRMGNAGAAAIGAGLERNSTLEELRLNANDIGPSGAAALGAALKLNRGLVILLLDCNPIDDDGVAALADGIIANGTLCAHGTDAKTHDEHHANSSPSAGAQRVTPTATLAHLSLCGTSCGDAGAVAIARAIKDNRTLTYLNLSQTSIRPSGLTIIGEALRYNHALRTLLLLRHDIRPGFDKRIAVFEHALQLQCSLTRFESEWAPPSAVTPLLIANRNFYVREPAPAAADLGLNAVSRFSTLCVVLMAVMPSLGGRVQNLTFHQMADLIFCLSRAVMCDGPARSGDGGI
jgi:Ran GTPase-activating protein (RanGAP) involved in mRNA processing and transport